MGRVLDTYHRYREILRTGDFAHLTDVVDEGFVENCVGLTGWTRGLDIASANFAAGIAAAAGPSAVPVFERNCQCDGSARASRRPAFSPPPLY